MTVPTNSAASSWPGRARQKTCWRCGESFVCGPGDAGDLCWCGSRSPASIANADADCLCLGCLTAMAVAPRDAPTEPIPSPCIKICRIAPKSGLCIGCLRTLDEIGAWSTFSDQERQAVFEALPGRKL
jgi:predicted Fe-S protein YdhL (DUF1289 family)